MLIDGCIHKTAKQALESVLEKEIRSLPDTAKNSIRKTVLGNILDDINALPECGKETTQKKGAKPRKRSKYQEFISGCMGRHSDEIKGKPFGAASNVMKACAIEWQAAKKKSLG